MYEPHRSLEPGAKRQEKTDLKEKLQPHPNERDKHVLTQEWRTVENTDYLYNVSDDETIHSSTSNPTAKVMSRRSGANLEEGHSGSRGSDQTLALTAGRVKQSVVKNTDNSLGTGDPSRKVTRSLKPPGREKAVTQTSLKTLSRPEDIPNDEHSLRQHPTRNRGGDLLLHAAPTGSIASTHVTPLVLKTKDWPIIIETAKKTAEAQTYDKNYLSTDKNNPQGKGRRRAISPLVPKLIDPENSRSAPKRTPFFFRAKRTVTPHDDDTGAKMRIEKGEILQFLKEHVLITDELTDKTKYLFERRNDPDDLGWVFAKDVEPVDKGAWLRRQKKTRGERHNV